MEMETGIVYNFRVKTDKQVRKLMELINSGKSREKSAMGADMSPKTARKYINVGKLPTELKQERNYKTRPDPFEEVWPEILEYLNREPTLESKILFQEFQDKYPGKYSSNQLRTLQRKIKIWKATSGPMKEIFFCQNHKPGELGASDFTNMNDLDITIEGKHFKHILYHFVLTYSNWQAVTICATETFEALSDGIQNALWRLGGVPKRHRTDRLTAAVNNLSSVDREFQNRYIELIKHYGIEGEKTDPYSGNENGDVEQSHYRLKTRIDQKCKLRGNRDFESLEKYNEFLQKTIEDMNRNCKDRFQEDFSNLSKLPPRRIEHCKVIKVKVGHSSTLRAAHTTYSVPSKLIGENVDVKIYGGHLEVWYAGKKIEEIPRKRANDGHFIQYRHIIDSLVRKPGAFRNYKYHADLFPTSNFRIAYDWLCSNHTEKKADKIYLEILYLAAKENETEVNLAIVNIMQKNLPVEVEDIRRRLKVKDISSLQNIEIADVNLEDYDSLLDEEVSA